MMNDKELSLSNWLPWIVGTLFVMILILWGGASYVGAQAFALLSIGGMLIIAPPRNQFSRELDLLALALTGWILLSVVPRPDFFMGKWLYDIRHNSGIGIATSISPQPWLTTQDALLYLAGLSWLYLVISWQSGHRIRKGTYWLIAICTGLLSLGVIIGQSAGWMYPLTEASILKVRSAYHFTYFPNRNQTSFVLAIGGVIAYGLFIEALKHRKSSVILTTLALSILHLAGIAMAISRAGVLLWMVGVGLLSVKYLRSPEKRHYTIAVFSLLVILLCTFLLSGTQASERVSQTLFDLNVFKGYRTLVYQDTLRMFSDYWLTGTGLGNFSYLFPHYRLLTQADRVILHPESDWLWLTVELGLPGLILFLSIAGTLGQRLKLRFLSHRGETLRITGSTVILLFALHSLFDVSGHRFASFALPVLVYGLACKHDLTKPYPTLTRWVWRLTGIILLGTGIFWSIASFQERPWHPAILHEQLESAQTLIKEDRHEQLSAILGTGRDHLPLSWRTQFFSGVLNLRNTQDPETALPWFRRACLLNPQSPSLAHSAGILLYRFVPAQAYPFLQQALSRADNEERKNLLADILQMSRRQPEHEAFIVHQLWQDFPKERLAILALVPDPLRVDLFDALLASKRDLAKLSHQDKTRLLNLMIDTGHLNLVTQTLNEHPALSASQWYISARTSALNARYEEACRTMQQYLPPPQTRDFTIHSVATLEQNLRMSPHDIVSSIGLMQHYASANQWEKLIEICTDLTHNKHCPPYVYYWLARGYALTDHFKASWQAWETYYRKAILPKP